MIKKLILPYLSQKATKYLLKELAKRYNIPISEINSIYREQQFLIKNTKED